MKKGCSNTFFWASLQTALIVVSVLTIVSTMLNKVVVDMYSVSPTYIAPSRTGERKVHIIGSDRLQSDIHHSNKRKPKVHTRSGTRCPSVLDNMSKGHWKQRVMTKQEVFAQQKFLNHSRKQISIISPISRTDGLCGNVTLPYNRHARALCYPTSKTPCCFKGRCVALPEEKCRCKNCYDVRQRVHAEYATWIPADKRCAFHVFSGKEACQLLANSTLYLFGDSHFRHFYTAMLMLLRNDPIGGGLKDSTNNVTLKKCPGPYQFGSKECRPVLQLKAKPLCNGSFNLKYISHTRASQGPDLYNKIQRHDRRKKSFVMVSLAAREGNNVTKFMEYLQPVINFVNNSSFKFPKLMWANGHAPGLLKSPVYERQGLQYMKKANDNMHKLLKPLGIPVFDTFNMTSTTISFDGTHYGVGVTTAKVQLLLNYLKELQGKHQW